ncbi:hypothetical protein Bhyg_06211 [Pseudolycoriella hygida]|uniref:Uncharacterized protein n=1 Tax=Pseudolycoriella hygida TaxID=35572 RepID=A0A9Q0N172_9DIPT|nr:hypothetical protein Bhyg_06211 [Pseudolycoriella hygida]
MALAYSTAELITGTIKSTPTPWFSLLANIEPPALRRKKALARKIERIQNDEELPIHNKIRGRTGSRLISRKPLWLKLNALHDFQPESDWRDASNDTQVTNSHLVNDPNIKPSGHDLDRRTWTQLNRIRTNHGRCNYTLNKWNPAIDPMSDCGEPNQTIYHIVNDCVIRKFEGGIEELNDVTDEAVETWTFSCDYMCDHANECGALKEKIK